MKKKLFYVVLVLVGVAMLTFIFGEKFLINAIIGGIMAFVAWLVLGNSKTGKARQDKMKSDPRV